MTKIPFDAHELESTRKAVGYWGEEVSVFNYPVTPKENFRRSLEGAPVWLPTDNDIFIFSPNVIPDNVSTGLVSDAVELPIDYYGNKDMFGVEWEYVPTVGGATVRPGNPMLLDMNDWKSILKFPDVDSWDWAGAAAQNRAMLEEKKDCVVQTVLLTSFFERMISLMDFADAAMALIDPEQRDATREFLEAMADLWIDIVDHLAAYFPGMIDDICVHDDWGSQLAPLFSETVVRELIMPPMKRLVEHIHKKGYSATFHCCGKVDQLVGCMVEIGWQSWEAMDINDLPNIYQKYGDRLQAVISPEILGEDATEEACRAAAERFVKQYCHPGKSCIICTWGLSDTYLRELYRQSRIAFQV